MLLLPFAHVLFLLEIWGICAVWKLVRRVVFTCQDASRRLRDWARRSLKKYFRGTRQCQAAQYHVLCRTPALVCTASLPHYVLCAYITVICCCLVSVSLCLHLSVRNRCFIKMAEFIIIWPMPCDSLRTQVFQHQWSWNIWLLTLLAYILLNGWRSCFFY